MRVLRAEPGWDAAQPRKGVATICHAGGMLASAGVVKGKTSFFSIKNDMANTGEAVVGQRVVVDGNLITSRKPDALPSFCLEIVRALGQDQLAQLASPASSPRRPRSV